MQYFSYDVKNAKIKMSTKNGEIYSFDELLKFNEKNSKYIKLTGVGNEPSSINFNAGGAVIEFDLNKDYFKDEILTIQKAVNLVDLDDFDVYPLEIIEKRSFKTMKRFDISQISLIGDYAKGNATKYSTIDFIVNFNELKSFYHFLLPII